MTTPNIEALIERLRAFSGTSLAPALMHQAAATLQSQAEHIAELERESETHSKAYGLAIVERDNLRHELKVAQEGWRCECSTDDACRFARERDALRAELDAIAATEPRAYEVYQRCSTKYSTLTYDTSKVPEVFVGGTVNPLFTRPMPAQDAEIAALKSALRTTIRTYVVDDDAWDTERETERFMKRAIDAAIEGAKR